jgi:CRP/FNR family cyclic AMP-dependent transcriptional regulator
VSSRIESKASDFRLSAEELAAIAKSGVPRAYPKNAIIVTEGDRGDSLYIVVEGRVKVFVSDENGKEAVLNVQGPGEYFGEMPLDDGPRSASVMTLEPSRFLVVPRHDFRDFLVKNPAFAVRVIEKLIHRVRVLTENVKSLALMDVYGRVARLLLELAEERDGRRVIPERLTQQEIANRVGASREMVSRILKDLSVGGYITQGATGIVIHKRPPARW